MKRTLAHNAKIGASLRARGVGRSALKKCPKCEQALPRRAFGDRPNGYTKSWCSTCVRAYNAERARRYWRRWPEKQKRHNRLGTLRRRGISAEAYASLEAAQGGVCAVCREPQRRKGRAHLDVDHCHKTGSVRGLLCSACNTAIGLMRDNPERLRAAAQYLGRRPR